MDTKYRHEYAGYVVFVLIFNALSSIRSTKWPDALAYSRVSELTKQCLTIERTQWLPRDDRVRSPRAPERDRFELVEHVGDEQKCRDSEMPVHRPIRDLK